MKIPVDTIRATPSALTYTEDVESLNAQLTVHGAQDFSVPGGLSVDVEYYRAGFDLHFRGALHTEVVGRCARCLEEFTFQLDHRFALVLMPRAAGGAPGEAVEDPSVTFYDGDEIDLAPLMHEETLLALPTRPLCGEGCRGLCAQCGANLNLAACGCAPPADDPRLAVLRSLVRER